MNQTTRTTITFVAAAAVLAGVAAATHFVTRPAAIAGFEKIGSPFYAEFDPEQANALRVVSYNADEARISEFRVEQKDGLWRIPSHHNYPADAKDQLARAAASLVGLEREALASRRDSDHERFGVISPESDDPTQLEGLGQRITIEDARGTVLADLIVGKEVEGRSGHYYVRRPDEKETYFAQLNIDLSTKFAKWIEQDLLKMDRWNVVFLVAARPGVSEEGRVIDRERVELFRENAGAQWQLAGLDEAAEEVNRTAVDDLLRNIDSLEIVGVRPKPTHITPDLRVNIPAEFRGSRVAMQRFAELQLANLAAHGFQLGLGEDDEPRIYSPEGEITLASNDGEVYHLHLGDVFAGTIEEIEIGGKGETAASNGGGPQANAASSSAGGDSANGDLDGAASPGGDSPADQERETSGAKLNRYVFVRARFDPRHIGPEPVRPEEPQPPGDADPASGEAANNGTEGAQPADGDAASGEPQNGNGQPANGEPADPDGGGEQADPAAAASPEAESPGTPDAADDQAARRRFEYEAARRKYETDLREYERQKSDYDRKVTEGQEKVDELNRRFRDWYYVISGATLENLKVARANFVQPRSAVQPGTDDPGATDDAPAGPALSPGEPPDEAAAPGEPAGDNAAAPSGIAPAAPADPATPGEPAAPAAPAEPEPQSEAGDPADSGEPPGKPPVDPADPGEQRDESGAASG